MSMHMIQGVQGLGKSKKKPKKLDMKAVEMEWRKYNKDMRRKNMHSLQFETLQNYVDYITGNMPKIKREFVEYAPTKSYVRDTKEYRSLQTSDSIPGACSRKEVPKYTGDLIVGIGQMHKSNAVPIMRGTSQAIDIAQMRRN